MPVRRPRAGSVRAVLAPVTALLVAGASAAAVAAPGVPQRPADAPAAQLAAATPPASGAAGNPAAVLASLSEAQRVGELLMAGVPLGGSLAQSSADISGYHVGSVILTGRSGSGVSATRSLTDRLQSLATPAATGGVPLLVAADQEGGYVQTLSGPGFSRIPTALAQGGLPAGALRADATVWGEQLQRAGVNLNLAPVLGTVPAAQAATNAPIGAYQREFGYTPERVSAAGTAFTQGMTTAGELTAAKHFPGLGRASGNTDTTAGVVDRVTTRHDPYVAPFAAAVQSAGAPFVMVSLATYPRIDPYHRAVFSPTVLQGMLRGDLGFPGVIMSDSMDAVAVRDLSPAQRAVDFVGAGGDLVLVINPAEVPAMAGALLARAQADPAFRARVDAACLRILIAKQRAGLLGGAVAAAAGGGRLQVAEGGAGLPLHTLGPGGWSGPVSTGTGVAFGDRAPGLAALPGGDGLEVAGVDTGHAVWVRSYPGGAWTSLGGLASSPPAVAAASNGEVDVAVRGPHEALWVRGYTPGGGWSPWRNIGGVLGDGQPALVAGPGGRLDAFVVADSQTVFENSRVAGRWSGWVNLGGIARSGPAAALDPGTGRVTLLVSGPHFGLWQRTVGAGGWSQVPDTRLTGEPAAAFTAAGVLTLMAEGLDGRWYSRVHRPAGWGSWSALPFS